MLQPIKRARIRVRNNLDHDQIAEILARGRTVNGTHRSKARKYGYDLNNVMRKYRINTPLRQAHFLAQIMHESGGFRYTEEIWGPTSAQRRYDPPTSLARTLGNINAGDGFKYRGRGFIQLTGRSNYEDYSRDAHYDFVKNPDRIVPRYVLDVAGWFWDKRNLNPYADRDDIRGITKRINGGYNGLHYRELYLKAAKQVLDV